MFGLKNPAFNTTITITPTPTPSSEQISYDSTFNVLQFNANGIGNKLTDLGVVLEKNKVNVAFIQESKLSSKSKNPCIRNYTTVRKDGPHGHGRGLLVFSNELITFSKQPSSPETLPDPHLEELTIKVDIGNTKLIISKIYIPPASSCSNGYQPSIEHLLRHWTPLSLVILTRTIRHGTQERLIQEEKEWTTQSTNLTMVYSIGIAP